jgi:HEAT repeat protein
MFALAIATREFHQCVQEGQIALEPLLVTLNDRNDHVLNGAVAALGALGYPRALQPLLAIANSNKTVANAATLAARRIVEKASGQVPAETLHAVVEMKDVNGLRDVEHKCGDFTIDWPVDCSQVKQLARQELIRRGVKA